MTATDEMVNVRYLVQDVQAALDFYTTHLGFTLRTAHLPAFADVTRGNLRLLLSGPGSSAGRPMPDGRRPVPGGWNRIHLIVTDFPPRSPGYGRPVSCSAMTSSPGQAVSRFCSRIRPATRSNCSSLRHRNRGVVDPPTEIVTGLGETLRQTVMASRSRPTRVSSEFAFTGHVAPQRRSRGRLIGPAPCTQCALPHAVGRRPGCQP